MPPCTYANPFPKNNFKRNCKANLLSKLGTVRVINGERDILSNCPPNTLVQSRKTTSTFEAPTSLTKAS